MFFFDRFRGSPRGVCRFGGNFGFSQGSVPIYTPDADWMRCHGFVIAGFTLCRIVIHTVFGQVDHYALPGRSRQNTAVGNSDFGSLLGQPAVDFGIGQQDFGLAYIETPGYVQQGVFFRCDRVKMRVRMVRLGPRQAIADQAVFRVFRKRIIGCKCNLSGNQQAGQ